MNSPFLHAFGSIPFFLLMIFPSVFAQTSPVIADGAELNLISDEFSFTEGPVADENGDIYFTDQPNNRIMRFFTEGKMSIYLEPSNRANGMYFDSEGNLYYAADEFNELRMIDKQGNISVLVEDFEGKRLNGPNDIWIHPDGGLYFTDPFYQRNYWNHSEKEIEEERVYYLSPDRSELSIAADGFVRPNGIIGTPDGKTLYVADIDARKTYSFSINEDGSLTDKTELIALGSDGMTIDNEDNLYLTGNGVTVFNKAGEQIEHITVPQGWTANVTFGGPEKNNLFITASSSLYSIKMKVHGVN